MSFKQVKDVLDKQPILRAGAITALIALSDYTVRSFVQEWKKLADMELTTKDASDNDIKVKLKDVSVFNNNDQVENGDIHKKFLDITKPASPFFIKCSDSLCIDSTICLAGLIGSGLYVAADEYIKAQGSQPPS